MLDEVLAANNAFYRAFNERDLETMSDLWARTVEVVCVHPGWNALHGYDDVLESWRRIMSNPSQGRIVAGGATVIPLGDAAVVSCRELVSGSPLAATNVFVQEDGEWRLALHQSGPVAQLD